MFELDRNYSKGKSDPEFTLTDLMTGQKSTYFSTGFDKDDYIQISLTKKDAKVNSVTIQAGTKPFNKHGIKGATFQALLEDRWEDLFKVNLSSG